VGEGAPVVTIETDDTLRPTSFGGDVALDIAITRNRIAEDARAAIGTGSTGPEARQRAYADRLFPGTNARLAARMADAMYSCALNYRAACRVAGVDFPPFSEDYSQHIGSAVSEIETMARGCGAYLSARDIIDGTWTPDAGDALVVDGPVHVIVIVERVEQGYLTSEGGAPEVDPKTGEHGMCVHSRIMALRVAMGRLQTGTFDRITGGINWGRFVLYGVDASKLRRTDE